MEDWKVFIQYAVPGGFMIKFDTKSGYHHVDIALAHQQFLGLSWPLGSDKPSYFCFNVLPFGLSSAPYLFTKLFRPLVRRWRAQGFHFVLYLDDGADCEADFNSTSSVSESIRSDLANASVVANHAKSVWLPNQVLEWLGLLWNLRDGILSIPHARIDKLKNSSKLCKRLDVPCIVLLRVRSLRLLVRLSLWRQA